MTILVKPSQSLKFYADSYFLYINKCVARPKREALLALVKVWPTQRSVSTVVNTINNSIQARYYHNIVYCVDSDKSMWLLFHRLLFVLYFLFFSCNCSNVYSIRNVQKPKKIPLQLMQGCVKDITSCYIPQNHLTPNANGKLWLLFLY